MISAEFGVLELQLPSHFSSQPAIYIYYNSQQFLKSFKFSESVFKIFRASNFRVKSEDNIMIDVVPVIFVVLQDKQHFCRTSTVTIIYISWSFADMERQGLLDNWHYIS